MISLSIQKKFCSGQRQFNLDLGFSLGGQCASAVFFGPSGSGKTLTMKCIAGLVQPDRGRILVNGRVLFDSGQKICLAPQKRRVGYMPQDYALFPQLTALQNVAYPVTGLWARFVAKKQKIRAIECLRRFGIAALANCLPAELSGGQKQRVALARAINANPAVLLLDEPFAALDPLLRQKLREETVAIFNHDAGCPAIIISHDPEDVDAFAGSVILYNQGKAKLVPHWQSTRAQFATAAECLLELQADLF